MTDFIKTHALVLTPLSPIHIGCGEDFEPTNYVIEEGILYGFDPSRATLNDLQRSKLADAARKGSIAGIQKFFREHASAFKPHAQVLIPVANGVAKQYEKRLGEAANMESSGSAVMNKLEIERHVYTGIKQLPFIPGTSFKGALRTAHLDKLNDGRRPSGDLFKFSGEAKSSGAFEKELLEGDFETSPLRLLKVSDLMPVREPEREVLFAVNRKKRLVLDKFGQEVQPKGISGRKDCVLGGQYRLFQANVTMPALLSQVGLADQKGKPLTPTRRQLTPQGNLDISALAKASNRYHKQRLSNELAVLDSRGLVHPDWKRQIQALLTGEVGRMLEEGKALLVRLGRYGGAHSKTLSGEGVASIKIMGAKGSQPTFESDTKTVWLSAQFEHDQKHLIPFGWALVEIDPTNDCEPLKAWCATHATGRISMQKLRDDLAQAKVQAEKEKQQLAAQAAQKAAEQAQALLAEQARAQALLSLSPQAQQTEKWRQACEDYTQLLPPKGNHKSLAPDVNKPGLYKAAAELSKAALESDAWSAQDKAQLAEVLETWLPKVVKPWDAKEQRKKLKFTALRGQV